jgi:hypothetical protein
MGCGQSTGFAPDPAADARNKEIELQIKQDAAASKSVTLQYNQ